MTPFLATPMAPMGRHDGRAALTGFLAIATTFSRGVIDDGLRSYADAGSSRAIGNSPVVPIVGTRIVVTVRVVAPDCSAYFAAVFHEISPRTASFSRRFHSSPSIQGPSWIAPGALGLPGVQAQVQPTLPGPEVVTFASPKGRELRSVPGWGRVWIAPARGVGPVGAGMGAAYAVPVRAPPRRAAVTRATRRFGQTAMGTG